MKKKEQISNGVFLAFAVNLVYTKGIGLTQGIIARQVGNDMWISTIFSILQGIAVILLTVWLIRRTPHLNIMGQTEVLLGRWASIIIGVLLFIYFLGAYSAVMITYVYHIKDYFAPDSPIAVPVIVAFIVGIYGAYKGIEVIGRFAIMGLMAVLIFNLLMILGSFSDFDIQELLPVMSSSFTDNIKASIHFNTDWAMVTMTMAMLLPLVKDTKVWGKMGVASIIYGGIVVLLWPILEIGVLSPEVTSQYIIACMQLARAAEIGFFIHRYEMIMVAMFAISLYVQIMLLIFVTSLVVAQIFRQKDVRTTIIPVGFILSAFGYWVIFNHNRAMTLLTYYWPTISMVMAFAIPLILFVIGYFYRDKLKHITAINKKEDDLGDKNDQKESLKSKNKE